MKHLNGMLNRGLYTCKVQEVVGEKGVEVEGGGAADVGFLEVKSRCQRKDGLLPILLQSRIFGN